MSPPTPHHCTNPSPDLDALGNDTASHYAKKYLSVGESTFDYASAWFGLSSYFRRN